jgi:RNA polymerase sigma-70 factor, ECF subfamily
VLRSEQTDEELMVQYQEGSEEAFGALYSRHSRKIFGYLKTRVRSEQRASDLFQEVFVKIHRSKHLYNKSLPVLPWIFSVTHSVLVDGLRKSNRSKEVYDVDFEQFSELAAEPADSLASITPLFEELSGKQQVALQMRYLEEKTFEEIAIHLKTSPTNVRQVISRSLKHLRSLVQKGDKS